MTNRIAKTPREIFKAHPTFGWTLAPCKQVDVRFRTGVLQNVDAQGNRLIPYKCAKSSAAKKIAIYGCSFTYGTGLADEETYPALLQQALPELIVFNKGVGGHGTVQGLLRFREDILRHKVDGAVFGVISDHRYRNLPHPYRMKAHLSPDWYRLGVEQIPHARFNRKGEIEIVFTPVWQSSLFRNDFDVFLPDEHVLDLITLAVFKEIVVLSKKHNVPVVFALLDQLDSKFNKLMTSTFRVAHDVSTPYNDDYNFLPYDIHPNQQANYYFAEQLLPIVRRNLMSVI